MTLNEKKLQEDYKSDAECGFVILEDTCVYIVGAGGLKIFREVLVSSVSILSVLSSCAPSPPWPSSVDPSPWLLRAPSSLALFRTLLLGLLWWTLLWLLVDPPSWLRFGPSSLAFFGGPSFGRWWTLLPDLLHGPPPWLFGGPFFIVPSTITLFLVS
ncbi:hypothetical protein EV424DRAFT_1551318 [Suillus variegatus]|nr:hypothetical protein EV424DRAFT_1551318 [Suillus variegatus]